MKTRFCPSPTGHMHIGNARTALFNFLAAKSQNGVFLLRIEDTDKERSKHELAEELMQDLHWLCMDWQEGPQAGGNSTPYWQSQRQAIYDQYYNQLIQQKAVYPCFCSDEELMLQRKVQIARGQPPRYAGTCRDLTQDEIQAKYAKGEKAALRFRVQSQGEIVFDDVVKGRQVFLAQNIGDFIIRRADGSASFIFCNAIDDALMGVTIALRGDDHLANTPRQLLIMQALNLPSPHYGHISLILGSDGAPLSKRNGSMSVADLREQGYLPHGVLNYLARLGHYYENPAWLDVEALGQEFQLTHLGVAPARFDATQLLHWQKEAVQRLDEAQFFVWCGEAVTRLIPKDQQSDFYLAIKSNVLFPKEVQNWADIFYQALVYSDTAKAILQEVGVHYFVKALELWQGGEFKAFMQALSATLNIKGKALFEPMRIALTGRSDGPELMHLPKLLGVDGIRARLQTVQETLA